MGVNNMNFPGFVTMINDSFTVSSLQIAEWSIRAATLTLQDGGRHRRRGHVRGTLQKGGNTPSILTIE